MAWRRQEWCKLVKKFKYHYKRARKMCVCVCEREPCGFGLFVFSRKGATDFVFVAWISLFYHLQPLTLIKIVVVRSFVLVVILSSLHKYQHCTDIAWFLKLHRWARRQQKYYSEDAGYPPICRTHIRSWFRFELEVNIVMLLAWEQWLFTHNT